MPTWPTVTHSCPPGDPARERRAMQVCVMPAGIIMGTKLVFSWLSQVLSQVLLPTPLGLLLGRIRKPLKICPAYYQGFPMIFIPFLFYQPLEHHCLPFTSPERPKAWALLYMSRLLPVLRAFLCISQWGTEGNHVPPSPALGQASLINQSQRASLSSDSASKSFSTTLQATLSTDQVQSWICHKLTSPRLRGFLI